MERLFNKYQAINARGLAISEEFGKMVSKMIDDEGEVDLRDLGAILTGEVTAHISDRILRKAMEMRKAEREIAIPVSFNNVLRVYGNPVLINQMIKKVESNEFPHEIIKMDSVTKSCQAATCIKFRSNVNAEKWIERCTNLYPSLRMVCTFDYTGSDGSRSSGTIHAEQGAITCSAWNAVE